MINNFIKYLESHVNKAIYVWGGQGQAATNALIDKSNNTALNKARAKKLLAKRIAENKTDIKAFDCSGLGVFWLLTNNLIKSDMTANTMYSKCEKLTKSQLKKGDWVFRYSFLSRKIVHIGYVVDDALNVVEDKSSAHGVIKSPVSKGSWNRYGRPPYFKDEIVANVIKTSVTTTTNVRDLVLTRPYMSGDDVKAVQEKLVDHGYPIKVDGEYGPETKKMVIKFQRANSLIADGIVGEKTLAALNKASAKIEYEGLLKVEDPFIKSDYVKAVQQRLNDLGYDVGPIDGWYGPKTFKAVRAFQKVHGLVVDGVVGEKTLKALKGPIKTQIKYSGILKVKKRFIKGDYVKQVQQALYKLGYSIKVDGYYGNQTKSIVMAFQKKYGLVVDGIVGPKTIAKLNELL